MNKILEKLIVKNQNCLITGASGKIGEKICLRMASLGYNLIITDNDINKLKILKRRILKEYNSKIFIFSCDLALYKSRNKFIRQIKKKFKNIRVLVNNAAMTGKKEAKIFYKEKSLKDKNLLDWHRHIEINLTAAHHLTADLSNLLMKSNDGRVINIGSIYSFIAPKWEMYKGLTMNNKAAYSASKGGLLQLTKWQATYYAPQIKVNIISPGGVDRDQKKIFKSRYKKNTPLKKMASEDDVVDAIVFLSSNLSNYVTGHNLIIDGGWSIK